MELKKFIATTIREYLNESMGSLSDNDLYEIAKWGLENEYSSSGCWDDTDNLEETQLTNIFVPFCAVAMGAKIIEKHFMIDKKMKCVDRPVSITEKQMSNLIKDIRRYENVLGDSSFGIRKTENPFKIFRRFS